MCLLTEELLMASSFTPPSLAWADHGCNHILKNSGSGRPSQVEEGFSPHIQSEASGDSS